MDKLRERFVKNLTTDPGLLSEEEDKFMAVAVPLFVSALILSSFIFLTISFKITGVQ